LCDETAAYAWRFMRRGRSADTLSFIDLAVSGREGNVDRTSLDRLKAGADQTG
jgi:hypothetical protein